MTLRTPLEAAKVAEATHTNHVGMCQQITHDYYNAPSVGDVDHDGDADAEDGWLSEPKSARHTDRHPPRGYPCSIRTPTHWHRLISMGDGVLRSSDFDGNTKRYHAGVMGNGSIDEICRAMNGEWVGWTETISGLPIPKDAPPPPTRLSKFHATHPRYDLKLLDHAVANGRSEVNLVVQRIDRAVKLLPNEKNTRVGHFLTAYHKDRILRMGLLNQAVDHGRHGTVEHVRDEIRHLIASLPPR